MEFTEEDSDQVQAEISMKKQDLHRDRHQIVRALVGPCLI